MTDRATQDPRRDSDPRPRAKSPLAPLLLRLEGATALDAAVRAAQPIMTAVTANPLVRDTLQGRWLSHALHPLLVEVPMGAWLSAAALDASGADPQGRSARFLTALGVVSAVPAALSGWAELAETGRRDQRVGVVHAAANGVGVVLQAVSWNERRRGHRFAGMAASAAALGAIGAAGLLGGHLAVARDVGTSDPSFDEAPARD